MGGLSYFGRFFCICFLFFSHLHIFLTACRARFVVRDFFILFYRRLNIRQRWPSTNFINVYMCAFLLSAPPSVNFGEHRGDVSVLNIYTCESIGNFDFLFFSQRSSVLHSKTDFGSVGDILLVKLRTLNDIVLSSRCEFILSPYVYHNFVNGNFGNFFFHWHAKY